MRMSALELDPTLLEALRTLAEHDVEFVVVGDVAEAIHNDGGFVAGLAVVPGSYGRIAGRPAQAQFDYRRMDLREVAPCSFITRHVDIDVNFEPPGTGGYRDLFDDASRIELAHGVRPLVAAPPDLERIARGRAPAVPYAKAPAALSGLPGDWSAADIRANRPTRI
jgi:hypothetical protein